jgi:hypothetical protein
MFRAQVECSRRMFRAQVECLGHRSNVQGTGRSSGHRLNVQGTGRMFRAPFVQPWCVKHVLFPMFRAQVADMSLCVCSEAHLDSGDADLLCRATGH